jgi:antitoxin ParD1/3/4
MSTVQKRTFSLAEEQAEFIDAKVASGDYASASEVVRDGLRALKEHDEAVERWLREVVVPRYDAMLADPSRGIPIEEAFSEIRARLKERYKDPK